MIDIHCHLSNKILASQDLNSIKCIVKSNRLTLTDSLEKTTNKKLINSYGIHPWDVEKFSTITNNDLNSLFKKINIKYLGEIGLDYNHKYFKHKDLQIKMFDFQLKYMHLKSQHSDTQSPIIIHCVKAWSDMHYFFKKYPPTSIRPYIFHGFSGNSHTIQEFLKYDYLYFSFGLKQLKRTKVIEALKSCPIDRIVLESDLEDQELIIHSNNLNKIDPKSYIIILENTANAIAQALKLNTSEFIQKADTNALKILFPSSIF